MSSFDKKTQSNFQAALFALGLSRDAQAPLHQQLSHALRHLILSDKAAPGARLPASRTLADELSVSRMTVQTAYDQLLAEGYLTARRGAGTFVATALPHLSTPPPAPKPAPNPAPTAPDRPFRPGIPDSAAFPHRTWARHLERAWARPDPTLLGPADPLGWPPLRAAIASHLSAWRAIPCRAEQVVITSGAVEAFDLILRACLPPGSRVVVEDPGYAPLRNGLARAGATVLPQRVDDAGLDPSALAAAQAAILTPSRHFPTGVTLPLPRRLAMLDWAARHGALIVEDDYDGEFRYRGQPLPALASLDRGGHVVYLGSFSKLLSPGLRLGYLVVPDRHLPALRRSLSDLGPRASLVPQPALAEFMETGAFAIHLRRMRRIYARRQEVLVDALSGASDLLEVAPDPAGMHLTCPLGPALAGRVSDRQIAMMGDAAGLYLRALSTHSVLPDPPQGLLLGYAAFDDTALRDAAARLLTLLRRA